MDFFSSPANLKLLQDLLKEPQAEESDSEHDDRVPNFSTKFSTPSTSSAIESQSANQPGTSASGLTGRRFRNIDEHQNLPQTLSEWEQQEALLDDNDFENRCTPEYRIVYKQSVTPEDIYLQMGNKTAATASCEEMCVEILLPNETVCIDRMELDVASHEIHLRTPNYRLKLPLVQPIDPDRSKASWDNEKKILRLTLRMKREYDFINF